MEELKTFDDLYDFARDRGYVDTASILRKFVDSGMSNSFMPNFTHRAICRCAGMALDGIPKDMYSTTSYIDTTRGLDLYEYMHRL